MFKPLAFCLFLIPSLLVAQEQKPELKVTQLSETLHLVEGGGGNVVVSGRTSRMSDLLSKMPVDSGDSPLRNEAREGPQTGYWQ